MNALDQRDPGDETDVASPQADGDARGFEAAVRDVAERTIGGLWRVHYVESGRHHQDREYCWAPALVECAKAENWTHVPPVFYSLYRPRTNAWQRP